MIMAKALPAAMDKLKLHEVLSTSQLKLIIANLSGLEGRIFDTDQTWRTLVIHSINKFEKLCVDTVDKARLLSPPLPLSSPSLPFSPLAPLLICSLSRLRFCPTRCATR